MSTNDSPRVSIVTVLYKTDANRLVKYIKAVEQIDYQNYELILINNDKNYSYKKILLRKKDIIYLENNSNEGFASASNTGIKLALKNKSEYVILLNSDTELEPNLIKELLLPFENPKVALVSPLILFGSTERIWYAGGFFSKWFGFAKHYYYNQNYFKNKSNISSRVTGMATGCCLAIRASTFQKIGFLDKDYFLYFEDVDFSMRAEKRNLSPFFLAKPLVRHLDKKVDFSPVESYYFGRNPFILIRKQLKPPQKLLSFTGQFSIRLIRNLIRIRNLNSLRFYFLGIYHGVLGRKGRCTSMLSGMN